MVGPRVVLLDVLESCYVPEIDLCIDIGTELRLFLAKELDRCIHLERELDIMTWLEGERTEVATIATI